MAQSRRRINIELLLGISATFLSLAALIVSIFQTRIAREQQQASVWPYIQTMGSSFAKEFHYGFANKGVGPAIIRQFELVYRRKTYPDIRTLFWEQIGVDTPGGQGFSTVTEGDVFKPGEDVDLLVVNQSDTVIQKVSAMISDTSFNLRIRYADVYGNCWLLDRDKTTPLGDCSDK